MANSKHYLDNQNIEEPRNWQDIEVTIDWTADKIDSTISLEKLEFVGATAQKILDRLNSGGYFEGSPYRIDIGASPTNTVYSFKGYLDYTDNPVIKACDIVEVALKREQGEDWLNEVADSFSYRYLASDDYNGNGKINESDYSGVPYVINYVPDGLQLLILSISLFSLTRELIQNIKDISSQISDLSTNAIPTVSAGFGVVSGWPTSKIVLSIIRLAIQIAYTVGIVYAIIKLIEQIIEQLLPAKRFHKGLPLRSLFQKACDHLNLTLESTLLDELDRNGEKWVLIPSKGHKGGEAPTGSDAATWRELGVPTSKEGLDTFGDVIRLFKRVFNANYKLKDGVFYFERDDYWRDLAQWTIPNTLTNQTALRDEYTVNTSDIKSNIVITWSTDLQDQNTLDNQEGRVYQVVTSPISVTNPELVNLKGIDSIDIPFSMAVRKNELTAVEEALKVLLDAADFLTGQLNKPQNFASAITSRLGAMHLSSHFLSVPKMVVMGGNNLAMNQRSIMSAKSLWENYHFTKSFVTIDDINNQQYIYSEQKIPFCFEDFVYLSNNNYVLTQEGEQAEIMTLKWNVESNVAIITYRVYRVYDTNLKLTFLE
jgi:hypothetical protein